MPVSTDDPVNPKHYAGTACAEIGEWLSGNSYQTLKYNWRLGKKDEAIIELKKSLWYLDREIALAESGLRWPSEHLPDLQFFVLILDRVDDLDIYVIATALLLVNWMQHGDIESLNQLRAQIVERWNGYESGRYGD